MLMSTIIYSSANKTLEIEDFYGFGSLLPIHHSFIHQQFFILCPTQPTHHSFPAKILLAAIHQSFLPLKVLYYMVSELATFC